MKLEDQVAPLDLARRLKALGFPQDTHFCWHEGSETDTSDPFVAETGDTFEHRILCAAPAVAEMGEWLPGQLDNGRGAILETQKRNEFFDDEPIEDERVQFIAQYSGHGFAAGEVRLKGSGATEAEARARLLIALAESGALDPKTLHQPSPLPGQ